MIYGIGVDMCDIRRIERLVERFGHKFSSRLLHPSEQAATMDAAFLARRFAAKEAVVKAMGTGFSGGLFLRDIRIVHDGKGRPCARLSGRAAALLPKGYTLHLSLADEYPYATAYAVCEVAP